MKSGSWETLSMAPSKDISFSFLICENPGFTKKKVARRMMNSIRKGLFNFMPAPTHLQCPVEAPQILKRFRQVLLQTSTS
jgi:hypothetical protein